MTQKSEVVFSSFRLEFISFRKVVLPACSIDLEKGSEGITLSLLLRLYVSPGKGSEGTSYNKTLPFDSYASVSHRLISGT